MNPQSAPTPPASLSAPAGSLSPAAAGVPSARAAQAAIPLPSLKPGEVITWVRLDPPKFPLGQIVISSFKFVGLAVLAALSIGILLGHLKSKRSGGEGAHGTGGLGLR